MGSERERFKQTLRELKRLRDDAPQERAQLPGTMAELTDPLHRESAGRLFLGDQAVSALSDAGWSTSRIALLSSSTITPVAGLVQACLVQRGMVGSIVETGFDQWRFEALRRSPELKAHAPHVSALLLDDRVVLDGAESILDEAGVLAACAGMADTLREWIDAARGAWGGLLVLGTIHLHSRHLRTVVDMGQRARLAAAWHRMNADILGLAVQRPDVVVLDVDSLAPGHGIEAPARTRLVSSQVYSDELLEGFASTVAAVAAAERGRRHKMLALDLDNTLWGGVVGDDGAAGLAVGGAYPGAAHLELQCTAVDLQRQGVMLTLLSKNEQSSVEEAFWVVHDMALAPEHLVGSRINWEPKPSNLTDLTAELNIGLDSVVFVDDNPAERALMRSAHPTVAVPELPAAPAGYAETLLAGQHFVALALSEEDRSRTSMYHARRAREEFRSAATDLTSFLSDLATVVVAEPLDEGNRARIVQLFGKTNQFNLTGLRYSSQDLASLVRQGAMVRGYRVRDRFGDNGLAGAAVVRRTAEGHHIDNIVLSCRVFSREVETAIVAQILAECQAVGATSVTAAYRASPKNSVFAAFYDGLGFLPEPGLDVPGSGYRHNLGRLPEVPGWIQLLWGPEIAH